ncbi:MAG TPA: PPOX class F420-dependent oxidoreductase [Candidatus Sulfotelmatobacter sp.]|nr:PPOX class F420-dependent oxidoreductase [Candidatus Sulfotelmatobacter sp.]
MSDANYFSALDKHDYLNLETFRKNGAGVRTPVWFAADPETDIRSRGAKLFIYTVGNTGKVKRVRNNSRVRIAPCDRTGDLQGDWIDANARIVEGAEATRGSKLLTQKYFLKRMFDLFAVFRATKRAVLVITPG